MSSTNKWFVLTGGPSTGKTTLLTELENAGYKVVQEAARIVIDEAVAAGKTAAELRKDELAFQNEVLKRKIAIEKTLDPQEVTIFDRGMHDSLAYVRYYGYELNAELIRACQQARYAQVFLLAPLAEYIADYARTEDSRFAAGIQKLLHDAYAEHDAPPLHVPPLEISERVAFIRSYLT